MSEKEETVVTAGLSPRHIEALQWVMTASDYNTKVDAVRKSILEYAKSLGWPDPNVAAPTPLTNRKATK